MAASIRILGIDPGLRFCGWGVIDVAGARLTHVANGRIAPPVKMSLAERLCAIAFGLDQVIAEWQPTEAAVEETFVNSDPRSALKLGQARGICLMTPARHGLPVSEYAANLIKKSVTGSGHADKHQIGAMVTRLLPGTVSDSADAADALAIAICHSSHRTLAIRTRA